MLATMLEARKAGLSYDVVDDLTGKKLGRASSGTFRTADVVGLDTMAHVIKTLQDTLSADTDPFYASFATPEDLAKLLAAGALGQKTGAGFYKKVGKDIQRFDPATGGYVAAGGKADAIVERMLKKPAAERLKLLRESSNPQAAFLWALHRNSFHYAAVHLSTIADSARDVDFAMRWGFGVKQGPFELWQEAGWKQVTQWIQEDIESGKALCKAAAAGLGVRRARRGAQRRRLVEPDAGPVPAAVGAAGVPAPALPRERAGRGAPGPGHRRQDPGRGRVDASVDAGRRSHHRQHQDQGACHRPGRDRRPAEGHRAG